MNKELCIKVGKLIQITYLTKYLGCTISLPKYKVLGVISYTTNSVRPLVASSQPNSRSERLLLIYFKAGYLKKKTLAANIIWGRWYRNKFVLITGEMAMAKQNRFTRKEPVPESSRKHLARGRRLNAWTMAPPATAFFPPLFVIPSCISS